MLEQIGEDIEAIVFYRRGLVQPLRFRWQQRVYRVSRINGQWRENEGSTTRYYFAVECGGDEVYEIFHDNRDQSWQLSAIQATH